MKMVKNKTQINSKKEEKNIQLDQLKEIENTKDLDYNLEKLEKEKNDLEEQLKRQVAEFENFKKRTEKEKNDLIEYSNMILISKFLILLDDISNAKESSASTNDIIALQKGIEMIYQKTLKLFELEGVKQIEVKPGDDFNVDLHEAILRQPSDFEENKIVNILQTGYTYKEKVLRYAKVSTSTGIK